MICCGVNFIARKVLIEREASRTPALGSAACELLEVYSGDTTPCRMTGVTLPHRVTSFVMRYRPACELLEVFFLFSVTLEPRLE